MRKHLFILFIVFLSSDIALAQNPENIKRDSLRIDSLKRLATTLSDTARINCLNKIGELFLNHAGYNHQKRTDSAFMYSNIAMEEAKKTGYKYGEVISLLILTRTKQFVQQKTASEKYIRQALSLTLTLNDDHLLARCYYLLAGVENRIENYKKAIYYFQKTRDVQQETEVTTWLCMTYSDIGEYEDGFPYCEKCIQLAKANVKNDTSEWGHELVQWSLFNMYILYKAAGDYESAMEYLLKGNQYANQNNLGWKMYADISELYCKLGKYDSALYYWNIWKKDWARYADGHQAYGNAVLAQIYLGTNRPDKALPLLEGTILTFTKNGREMESALINPLLLSAETFAQKRNPFKALKYVQEGLELAEKSNKRPEMMKGYQLISSIYHQMGNNGKAYEYILKSISIKDSIQNRQFLLRLYNYKRQVENLQQKTQINFLNKENQLKKSELKQQALIKNSLAGGLFLLMLSGIFIFRNQSLKRKNERFRLKKEIELQQLQNEQKQTELRRQAVDLEMQALRAQMNPHFIFNCLSSINRFIFKNDNQAASDYLTKFSRLIRMVLIHSQKRFIPLEDELEMLRLYLDMERLRFKNEFDYSITTNNTIDAGAIFIPPLLLQPFCENAIWHGLMHKEGRGQLSISITDEKHILHCSIVDNGVGRLKAAQFRSKSAEKEKSLGLKITTARLALLNGEMNNETSYKIDDVLDGAGNVIGTRVDLKIKYKEIIEETEHA